jgi:hypothetical protein
MKTHRELRKFGITMAAALLVFGLFFLWRDKAVWPYLLGLAGAFGAFALVFPKLLAPIEWAWMKLAHVIGTVVTYILLTLTFYLIIMPLGLVMRLFGKDSLALQPDPTRTSFWIEVKADGPASRPDKPY